MLWQVSQHNAPHGTGCLYVSAPVNKRRCKMITAITSDITENHNSLLHG